MTIPEKINFIREERFHDLNDWEQEFITDVYESISTAIDPTEKEINEFLTRRQITKIEEIWENLGL